MVAIVIRDPTQNAKRYADDVGCVICVSPKTEGKIPCEGRGECAPLRKKLIADTEKVREN